MQQDSKQYDFDMSLDNIISRYCCADYPVYYYTRLNTIKPRWHVIAFSKSS